MKLNKNQTGITLIALVITIIIMLILVAVTINTAINGGLFTQAQTAALKTRQAIVDDEVNAWKASNSMSEYTNTGYVSPEDFIAELISRNVITVAETNEIDTIIIADRTWILEGIEEDEVELCYIMGTIGPIAMGNNNPIIVRLKQGGHVIKEENFPSNISTSSQFSIAVPSAGTYDLEITKLSHTKVTITGISVSTASIDLNNSSNPNIQSIKLNLGDVNGDGVIDMNDANLVMSNYTSIAPYAIYGEKFDLNMDGIVDSLDTTTIVYYMSKTDSSIPY